MAEMTDNTSAGRFRCVQCGQVDRPGWIGPGPAWIAVFLWLGATVAWVIAWYAPGVMVAVWVLLLAALIYTLWYFAQRERACRHCGARELEPDRGSAT